MEWIDDSDTALINTVGGVLIQNGTDAESLVGVNIVNRTLKDAEARFYPDLQVDPLGYLTILGLKGGFNAFPHRASSPARHSSTYPLGR